VNVSNKQRQPSRCIPCITAVTAAAAAAAMVSKRLPQQQQQQQQQHNEETALCRAGRNVPPSASWFVGLGFNPLKGRDINWFHLSIQVKPRFLIFPIRALWRSALSARVSKCQKLKI